ncbi:MAG: sensor histidine kinase [bacterium]
MSDKQLSKEEKASWKILSVYAAYRIFSAGFFILAILQQWVQIKQETFAFEAMIVYGLLSLILLGISQIKSHLETQAFVGTVVDIALLFMFFRGIGGLETGAGILFVIPLAFSAMLLRGQFSLALAAIAGFSLVGQQIRLAQKDLFQEVDFFQAGLHGLAFISITTLVFLLSKRLKTSQDLAQRRGIDLENLNQLNELILQRMRTGIVVVDMDNTVRQMNEAAWYLMGMPGSNHKKLGNLSVELKAELHQWKQTRQQAVVSLQLAEGVPAIVPRFVGLGQDNDLAGVIVFLEDTSMVARRAEEMTLASLGELAASIAHEIRNPLGAIAHAQQLLAENKQLNKGDVRLVKIIGNHCVRMNEIVDNVLQLSRRERSRPETIKLDEWLADFADEFCQHEKLTKKQLEINVEPGLLALMDKGQLQQVIWNLCGNAVKYGHMKDQPVKIVIQAGRSNQLNSAILDVMDEGPGIPKSALQSVFQPFYSSSANSSGLGLYITKQICEANQAKLEYVQLPAGGACFRVQFAAPRRAFTGTSPQGREALKQIDTDNLTAD